MGLPYCDHSRCSKSDSPEVGSKPICAMTIVRPFLDGTEGDSIREGLWHQKFTKMATSNSLRFMVLFMCKKHVIKNKINI